MLEGGRLHLHHGPIDVIVHADGPEQSAAYAAAVHGFETILTTLVDELDLLTTPLGNAAPQGPVAKRMAEAIAPLAMNRFVTPMAAVAGAVADEILQTLLRYDLRKATVNNGGDIAFFLTSGQKFAAASPAGPVHVGPDSAARGLATSGWRGRSQSLGIADAVTVLATTAARADAAATLIANAVDLPNHPAITRAPARDIETIPQLKDRAVTIEVGRLTAGETLRALDAGQAYAAELSGSGLILGASLLLNEHLRTVGSAARDPLTPLAQDVIQPS